MASPSRPVVVATALLLVVAAAALLLLCSTGSSEDGYLLGRLGTLWGASIPALPFSPTDVLPLLPRGVAMAALRALRGVSDIFPVFVGAASVGGPGAAPGSGSGGRCGWKGACFYENEVWPVLHNESSQAGRPGSGGELGGAAAQGKKEGNDRRGFCVKRSAGGGVKLHESHPSLD